MLVADQRSTPAAPPVYRTKPAHAADRSPVWSKTLLMPEGDAPMHHRTGGKDPGDVLTRPSLVGTTGASGSR